MADEVPRQGQVAPEPEHGTAPSAAAAVELLRLIHAVLDEHAGSAPPAQPAQPAHLLAALIALRELREQILDWEPRLIAAARARGVSWAALAPALGVMSRQAAERRFLRLRPSGTGETTGEQRVQAERGKRAGDRAVARWARENSASLRRLAGQIGALTDRDNLDADAQHHAERVQQALADDDPAALLSPLADAHPHLPASHTVLAEQIDAVTQHAEQLRRETRERRTS